MEKLYSNETLYAGQAVTIDSNSIVKAIKNLKNLSDESWYVFSPQNYYYDFYNNFYSRNNIGWEVANTPLLENNQIKMKETKQTRFKVIFQETRVQDIEFDILAESLEDAKKKIEEGQVSSRNELTTSFERVIKS